MSFSSGVVKLIKFSNIFYTSGLQKDCRPFIVDGKTVGLLLPNVVEQLRNYPDEFLINANENTVESVELHSKFKTFDEKSGAVAKVINEWRSKNIFCALKGWRNEDMHVWKMFSEPALLKMERSAISIFGVKQYGAHINGYLYDPIRGLCMWIGTRSQHKATWPGKYDQMAAGGLSVEDSIVGCARRECQEEASVPDHLLDSLKPVGCISYFYQDERGLFPETQFMFDLEVPLDFTPVNADGEVEKFTLMDLPQLKDVLLTDKFKFNCALVVLDFFIRHSILTPDEEPNYSYLIEGMHRDLL